MEIAQLHQIMQWNRSKVDTISTTTECLRYGGIHNSGASGVFPVGLVMCTRAAEDIEAAFTLLLNDDEADQNNEQQY